MHDLTRQAALGRVFAIPLMGIALALAFAASAAAGQFNGVVVGITDGDTVKVLDGQRVLHTVRLAGIDAPEKQQPFGQRAKQHLSDLAFNRSVVVEGEKLDRYGRLVGKILVSGKDANLSLVRSGAEYPESSYEHLPAHPN